MLLLSLLFTLPYILYCLIERNSRLQCVGLEGRLTCDGKPYGGADIDIYENISEYGEEANSGLIQQIAEVVTNNTGRFSLYGCILAVPNITPRVEIIHNCNSKSVYCAVRPAALIPSGYVEVDSIPKKFYNLGTKDLRDLDESIHCYP